MNPLPLSLSLERPPLPPRRRLPSEERYSTPLSSPLPLPLQPMSDAIWRPVEQPLSRWPTPPPPPSRSASEARLSAQAPPFRSAGTPLLLSPQLSPVPQASGAGPVPDWRAQVRPLLTAEEIDWRVRLLGRQIAADYAHCPPGSVVLMGVLMGGTPFFADLMRHIDLPVGIDVVRLASYGSGRQSSGSVQLALAPSRPVLGKHVIVVEDIIDTGLSMQHLLATLRNEGAASAEVASLLVKPSRARVQIDARYVGFAIEDQFVVGYGLDDDGKYRNLPFVGVVGP